MKVFICHSVLRGKNEPSLVGIKIDKVFADRKKAEEFATGKSCKETIINGQLVEIRMGITETEVEE